MYDSDDEGHTSESPEDNVYQDIPVELIQSYLTTFASPNESLKNCLATMRNEVLEDCKRLRGPIIALDPSNFKNGESFVFSSGLSKSMDNASDTLIVDGRPLGLSNFSDSLSLNYDNYKDDIPMCGRLWSNSNSCFACIVLRLSWTSYAVGLIRLMVSALIPEHCASLVIDFTDSLPADQVDLEGSYVLANILSTLGHCFPAVNACRQLVIRGVPHTASRTLSSAVCPFINLLPHLELVSVTTDSTSQQPKSTGSEAATWARCLHLHPSVRFLQLHDPHRPWLPVHLLTGSTSYGYIGLTGLVEFGPVWLSSSSGGSGLEESEFPSNVAAPSLSDLETELIARLIFGNTFCKTVQLSARWSLSSHRALMTVLKSQLKAEAKAVGQTEEGFSVVEEDYGGSLCCTIHRLSNICRFHHTTTS